MTETEGLGEIVEDRLLDGRLLLRQPRKGHRAGTDAVLLAAALPELAEGPLLDMGAAAVYPPGSVIADTAADLIEKLNLRLGYAQPAPAEIK